MTSTPRYPCEKCKGSGTCFGGKCCACKGRGGFATSPEARKRKADRQKVRRIENARHHNQEMAGLSIYAEIIRNAQNNLILRAMRLADVRGRKWSTHEITIARGILAGSRGEVANV